MNRAILRPVAGRGRSWSARKERTQMGSRWFRCVTTAFMVEWPRTSAVRQCRHLYSLFASNCGLQRCHIFVRSRGAALPLIASFFCTMSSSRAAWDAIETTIQSAILKQCFRRTPRVLPEAQSMQQ